MQGDNVTKTGKIIWPRHLMLSFSKVFPVFGEKVNLTFLDLFSAEATAHGKNLHNLIGNNELRDAELISHAPNPKGSLSRQMAVQLFFQPPRRYKIPVQMRGV